LANGRLVLWDIDLTLVRAGEGGRAIYAAAFERATGRPLVTHADAAGRLDPDIFRDTLSAHGMRPQEHSFDRFAEALAAAYAAQSFRLLEHGRALPGAAEALAALSVVPGVIQTVLTGNIRAVAIAKLAAFGLDGYIDFGIGAYGADDPVRANLVKISQRRASERYHLPFDRLNTVLIGDTPHDVIAGREGGALVIAVASGRYSRSELLQAGADVAVPGLTDLAVLLRAVGA
jgi:phosphoglycolate phosphatase